MIEEIEKEKCTRCWTCVEVCPMDVFRMNKEKTYPEIKYKEDCQTCYNCEIDCPAHAIKVNPWRKKRAQPW